MPIDDSAVPSIYLQEPGPSQSAPNTWQYTTRQEWSTDIESAWMRISKFALYNRLTYTEMCRLLIPNEREPFSTSIDLRVAGRLDLARVASILRIEPELFNESFCCTRPRPKLRLLSRELRYCRHCLDTGFHPAWFQWKFIERCPLHNRPIQSGCPCCRAPIAYALDNSLATSPLQCIGCGTRWVTRLDQPAGSCAPLPWRHRFIHRCWDHYVRSAVARSSAIGKIRSNYLRDLNRAFDFPPPLPEDIIGYRRHETPDSINRATTQTTTQLVTINRRRWRGFGKQFKQAEIMTLSVITLALKEAAINRSLAKNLQRLQFNADDLTADQAGTIGWAVSWSGRSHILSPQDPEQLPALGLAGWLAHLPHQPRNLGATRWQNQVINWLHADLIISAQMWKQICQFMGARKHFLLEPGVCPPSVFALRH